MAKKPYDGSINRHTVDFSKAGPKGEPASGLAIQRYIKQIDNTKFGAGMTTEDGSEHLFFIDAEDMQTYIEDPTREDLIVDRIQMESLYHMTVTAVSNTYVPVFLGSTGNYIKYTFATKNRDNQDVSEPVIVTYTIQRGTTTQTVTENYQPGTTVSFNVDKYLLEGTNSIGVLVKGRNTRCKMSLGFIFQVINLSLTDNTDISNVIDAEAPGAALNLLPHVKGVGLKTMEWYLDGVKLDKVVAEDEISDSDTDVPKSISVSNIPQGRHSIQFRVGLQVAGEMFYSDTKYREFIVSHGNTSGDPVAVVAAELNPGTVLGPNEPLSIELVQYQSYNLRVAAWNPSGSVNNVVTISIDGDVAAQVTCTEGEEVSVPITLSTYGQKVCTIAVGGIEREISLDVSETTMDVKENTTGLEFAFSSDGRSNASSNRASWTDGIHAATFTGFDWSETSGWVDGKLLIPSGASLSFDYAPLSVDPQNNGKTLEFEFKTVNVDDDNAVLCDITNANGTGIKITATEVSIKTNNVAAVTRQFKSEENIRVSIVINQRTGATNKGLIFVYFNGLLSMAFNVDSNGNLTSDKQMVFGGTGAGILLKQIRVYNTALSSEAVLKNHILYRDTLSEMISIYDKNNLYEEGTTKFDVNKIAAYLPVMIITGAIPEIEATMDKNYQIKGDIEYINLQDPTRSFKLKDAAIRGQGTTSMTYPKKNLRIYSAKTGTVMYDYEDNIIADGLYSFKAGAQPVDCWCLKTDFAESSGTHNTGIARLWNDIIKNVTLTTNGVADNKVLWTEAQKAAKEAGYPYDVRTTIDGFPIAVFYHMDENDDLVFLGKYNFNNDKSTESVFGFKGIPGFDNSHVECWEFLTSVNDLALFHTTDGWDTVVTVKDGSPVHGWEQAWEARYPDKNTDTTKLKRLADWLSSTYGADANAEEGSEAKLKFDKWQSEKSQYFDMPKLASYYVYLMRFGAVDQTVKNAMVTTEDGIHWFFILYDNDTVMGVRNDGLLKFGPEIDRQTEDAASGGWAYAGHSSTLWNNFEMDPECMELAKRVDAALYTAGLTYENVIRMFNEEQAGKWSESIYNNDAEYKYVGPYVKSGGITNYLGSLQGSRADHRKWWLSNRFALYDALYTSGAYIGTKISMIVPGAENKRFTITSGKPFYYGYGVNNDPLSTGTFIGTDSSHEFEISNYTFGIGDPLAIYAPYYIKELDLSDIMTCFGEKNHNFSAAYHPTLGSKMKTLILGRKSGNDVNTVTTDFSTVADIITLENLNVAGFQALKNLNLTKLVNLKTLNAEGSGLTSITFAPGAPLTSLNLPSTLTVLNLRNVSSLNVEGITFDGGCGNIDTIDIHNCPNLSKNPELILNWISDRNNDDYTGCSVYMDNVDWYGVDPNDVITIGQIRVGGGSLALRGTCYLNDVNPEIVDTLTEIFGSSVFNEGNEFFIKAPDSVFVTGPTEILEGESAQYSSVIFSDYPGSVVYVLSGENRQGVSLNRTTGELATTETNAASATISIVAIHTPSNGGSPTTNSINVIVQQRTYPNYAPYNSSIIGEATFDEEPTTYTVIFSSNYTGDMIISWSLSGDILECVDIDSSSGYSCILKKKVGIEPTTPSAQGTLTANIRKRWNNYDLGSVTKSIAWVNDSVAITKISNSPVMTIMYNNGLASNQNYMTKDEAAAVTENDLLSNGQSIFYGKSNIKSFDEFRYFTGLISLPNNCFYNCSEMQSITLPNYISVIGGYAFNNCKKLQSITIPDTCTVLGDYAFFACEKLEHVIISDKSSLNSIGSYCFAANYNSGNYPKITSINLPKNLTTIGNYAFQYDASLESVYIPNDSKLSNIGTYAFAQTSITSITLPDDITTIGKYAFDGCKQLESVYMNENCLLQTLSECCFRDTALQTFDIPNNVTQIENSAFSGSELLSIYIPASVTTILTNPFHSCRNLESITVDVNNQSFDDYDSNCIVRLSDGYLITGCKNTSMEVFNTVHKIYGHAFYGSGLTSLNLPNGMESVGECAFMECKDLKTVEILSSNCNMGRHAFRDCAELESVTLNCNPCEYVFYGCTKLSSVTLNNTVTRIYSYAFDGCASLRSIHIPNNCTAIGNSGDVPGYAFRNVPLETITVDIGNNTYTTNGTTKSLFDKNLTTLYIGTDGVIPESVVRIGNYAYSGRGNKNVDFVIPNTISVPSSSSGEYNMGGAFEYSKFKSVTISDNVETIGSGCFNYADIDNIYFSQNSLCKNISQYSFRGCTIKSFVMPPLMSVQNTYYVFQEMPEILSFTFSSVGTYLQGYSLTYCPKLTEINIPEGITRIGQYAFRKDTALKDVILPSTLTSMDGDCFSECDSLETVTCLATTPPSIQSSSLNWNRRTYITVYVPAASTSAYQNASGWNYYTIVPIATE